MSEASSLAAIPSTTKRPLRERRARPNSGPGDGQSVVGSRSEPVGPRKNLADRAAKLFNEILDLPG